MQINILASSEVKGLCYKSTSFSTILLVLGLSSRRMPETETAMSNFTTGFLDMSRLGTRLEGSGHMTLIRDVTVHLLYFLFQGFGLNVPDGLSFRRA